MAASHKLLDTMLDYCEPSLWILLILLASLFQRVTCKGVSITTEPTYSSRQNAGSHALRSMQPLERGPEFLVLLNSKTIQDFCTN